MEVPQFAGITAHDWSYLAEFVLAGGYVRHRVVRHTSSLERSSLAPLWHTSPSAWDPVGRHLGPGDLTDGGNVQRLVRGAERTEVYTLETQRHVGVSYSQRGYTNDAGRPSTPPLTDSTQNVDAPSRPRQASTSELCGTQPPLRTAWPRFRRGSRYAVAALSTGVALVPARSAKRVSNAWVKGHQGPHQGPYLTHCHRGRRVCLLNRLSFGQIGGMGEALESPNGGFRPVRASPRGYTMARLTATASHKGVHRAPGRAAGNDSRTVVARERLRGRATLVRSGR